MGETVKDTIGNWKRDRIIEYARLEKAIATETHEMDIDPEINMFMEERKRLDNLIKIGRDSYLRSIGASQQRQIAIKEDILDNWDNLEEKTFKCEAGSATLKTTRSLRIQDKKGVIDLLLSLKKLPDFIKSFEIAKLRKIKDAGLIEDSVAAYVEKKSIVMKIGGEKQ